MLMLCQLHFEEHCFKRDLELSKIYLLWSGQKDYKVCVIIFSKISIFLFFSHKLLNKPSRVLLKDNTIPVVQINIPLPVTMNRKIKKTTSQIKFLVVTIKQQ